MTDGVKYQLRPGMRKTNPPATPAQIEDFESDLGFKLPKEYRQFLLDVNGVEFEATDGNAWNRYPRQTVWEEEHSTSPKHYPPFCWPPKPNWIIPLDAVGQPRIFLGIRSDGKGLLARSSQRSFNTHFPRHLLVIGQLMDTDLLCIECNGARRGEVFEWNTLFQSEKMTPNEALKTLCKVGSSFGQIWERLILIPNDRIGT